MSTLSIPSPAKINLLLKVTGKRPDGYHEIVTLLARISLFDTIVLTFGQPGISVQCPHPLVPEDGSNLACTAARAFFQALGVDDGVAIDIDKVIPVAAGLGGGSSNAAAVLLGLNEHYGFALSEEKLKDVAAGIGADVPFFLFKDPAVARGIGDNMEPFGDLPRLAVVLVCPQFQVSTAWVYKNLKLTLTNYKKDFKIPPLNTHFSRNKHFLFNDLEQVTVGKFPEISLIKKGLRDLGAEIALMSGSGPTVFGLFEDVNEATNAVESMKNPGKWETFLVDLLLP
jgi:4-diphosphocytidyl-2-C-methyl-D-erythritol kinase